MIRWQWVNDEKQQVSVEKILKSDQETCLKTIGIILFIFLFCDASGAEIKQLHVQPTSIYLFIFKYQPGENCKCDHLKKVLGYFPWCLS